MSSLLGTLKLLIWKECAALKAHPALVLSSTLSPILWFIIIIIVQSTSAVKKNKPIVYPPFNISGDEDLLCNGTNQSPVIAYSPSSSLLQRIVSNLCNPATVAEFESAAKLDDKIDSNTTFKQSLVFAVQFNDKLSGIDSTKDLPNTVNVTLRFPVLSESEMWHTDQLYPDFQTPGPWSQDEADGGEPYYRKRGFLYLQQKITFAFIEEAKLEPPDLQIEMKRFPFEIMWYEEAFFSRFNKIITSVAVSFSLCCFFLYIVAEIVLEREAMLLMEVMGLPRWRLWLGLILKYFILILVTIIIIVILITSTYGMCTHCAPTVMFVFLMLFACCTIALAFLVAAFVTEEKNFCCVGCTVYILMLSPGLCLEVLPFDVCANCVLASSLFSNSGVIFGMRLILDFEYHEEGVHWTNLWEAISPDEHITLAPIMIMLLVDTILYLALALCADTIISSAKYGTPWSSCFRASRNKSLSSSKLFSWMYDLVESVLLDRIPSTNDEENFENYTGDLPVGIQLVNLSKTFEGKTVVENLNLDVHEGQITVLLGDNGAGKNITAYMIVGLCPPSNGTAIVNGYDVRTNMRKIRTSLGYCPEDNIYSCNLTVWENLYLSGKLKGTKNEELEEEIEYILRISGLNEQRDDNSRHLSGDDMRALNVGMALCGNPKIVILEEPTGGMDTPAKSAMFDLIQQQSRDRTILIVTSSTEVADFLGDRIAVMINGRLQCCGSRNFLKRQHGKEYYLFMDVAPECKPDQVTNFLQSYTATVKVPPCVGSKLSYRLLDKYKLGTILSDLENNMSSLGVQSYRISVKTLGDVLTKFGAVNDNKSTTGAQDGDSTEKPNKVEYCTGFTLLHNQVVATFTKNKLISFRSWYLFLAVLCIQIVLLLVVVLSGRSVYDFAQTYPPLEISLDTYDEPAALLSGDRNRYYDMYEKVVPGHQLAKVDNINTELMANLFFDPPRHYLVAASFTKDGTTAWFNGDVYHTPPLALSLVLNLLFKSRFGQQYLISFVNYPLPPAVNAQLGDDHLRFSSRGFGLALAISLGMTILAAVYSAFRIIENSSEAKHLQFLYGIDSCVYWGTSFICDFVTFLIIVCVVIFTLAALQEEGFKTPEELGRVTIVLITFGASMIGFVYLATYVLKDVQEGLIAMLLEYFCFALLPFIVVQLLEYEDKQSVSEVVHWIFLFWPFYSVAKAIYDLRKIHDLRKTCSQFGDFEFACTQNVRCCNIDGYFSLSTPGIGRNILIFVCELFLYFAIFLCLDYGLCGRSSNKTCCKKRLVEEANLEHGMQEENDIINNTQESVLIYTYIVVLRNVTIYHKFKPIIENWCLGVKPYECFGIFGDSDYGKTTLLKIMFGDIRVFSGDIWVQALDVKTKFRKVCKLIGYCPQLDALLDNLTSRETLRLICLIRGVPSEMCNNITEQLASELDFSSDLEKRIQEISPDSRRKLCVAIASIGDPSVIYFDEPTTGMDPASQHTVWSFLTKLRNSGKCVILTTTDLEECEVLCTRLSMLIEGKIGCLGSIQELKNKYAQMYVMTIKMKRNPDRSRLNNQIIATDKFIQMKYPEARLTDNNHEMLFYELENPSVPLSNVFQFLERNRKTLHIEGYTLEQGGLQQALEGIININLEATQESESQHGIYVPYYP